MNHSLLFCPKKISHLTKITQQKLNQKMKNKLLASIVVALLGFAFSASVSAVEKNACAGRFKKSDDMAFCKATSSRNISACEAIGDSDKRNFCMAQISMDAKYCGSIDSAYRKKQCATMTSGKDTVASHRN
jgi:hypothetical protein